MARHMEQNEQQDGIDRRGFLKCMAWAGTGKVWAAGAGGLLSACSMHGASTVTGINFVQVRDSHVGFSADGVNTDVIKTLQQVVDRINALPQRPSLVLHTGDLTRLSKPAPFDTVQQIMSTIKTDGIFYVPGEHDITGDNGTAFRQRFAPKALGKGCYSMNAMGTHFVGLSNVGVEDQFGVLGTVQLDWLSSVRT